uniref:Protein polybromo-1 n=2 Tax=Timema TaxID=61471 RepID=A0A7R9F2R7_9NEOP|nr:unnamed protein product [Timema bartmani]
MSKRRRTSSVASRQEEETDTDSTPEPSRKRKKLDPAELCQQVYDVIRSHKKEDGALLCDSFIRAPKRRQEPGYYEVVSNPIDLLKVQQKLKTDEYEDIDELSADIQLMVNNTKAFYKRTSQEYKDACELWELFVGTKSRLLDSLEEASESKGKIILKVGKLARRAAAAAEARKQDVESVAEGENSESSSIALDEDMNQYEELFTAVMMATDPDNRSLHTVFQLLPSKKRYPEYYEVIENPVDLKIIATKIQQNKYTTLSEMEKDLLQMTKNACLFNEPGSQIYKDAKALKKIITSKKIEVEHGKFVPGKTSERIRNKRLRGVQSLSAITAALRDEDEESDEGETMDEEVDDSEDTDNPRWQLYEAVKTATTNAGVILSEPFWKLPSKRYYPDYFKEIKNPVSLFQIKKKLKRGDYGTVSEVAGDMNIMFENAKKYNRADSKLYKDAVKLQKVMQTKVHEILDFDQRVIGADSDSEDDSDDKLSRRKIRGRVLTTPKTHRYKDDLPLKKRFNALAKCLLDYVHEDGRQPILMFMEKPSKKLYPDYFQVITDPIDMLTIQSNITNEKYNSEEEIVNDFKLMFNNCRQYNEEGSMIYEDANKLEQVLMDKLRELGPMHDYTKKIKVVSKTKKNTTVQAQKLRTLYDTIRDYRDPKVRQLSLIFQKLPSKNEYPDYYEVIKRPIDLERIGQKLKSNQYESLEDMVSDFVLMFDNACKYNEPDSQIYKDALMLQRVALQTKLQLREDEEAVPDVNAAVQELLTSLFISIYNHQDEEGRCFSDSMAELPEHDEVDGRKVRALSFDLIKRRLDRGLYRRLDIFQEDVFACLERARRLSRTDSQVFEDSIELQSYFIKQRDELCRGGDLLHSPALNFSLLHLAATVESTRQHKLLEEQPEEEVETRSSEDSMKVSQEAENNSAKEASGESMSFNQQVYHVSDFVYAEPKERGMEPSIIHIERLWNNQEGQQMMYGNVFFRPNETYHVTTRKFLEKEVFKSDIHKATPLEQVLGKCCVLHVKDYVCSKPEGFLEKDVYVCESRYSSRARAFKKIKVWPFAMTQNLKLLERDEVIEPKRIMSVFRERIEKHKEEIAELEEREKFLEKEKPNVEIFYPQGVEGHTYYEQYNAPACLIRSGDCVYVKNGSGRQLIAQVDTIWTTKVGVCYFRGPWLVTPPEIPHAPTRLFYKQEVFLSLLEDTHSVDSIAGKCAVLEHAEYISCRPTEIPESDVFVCESMYDEAKQQVKKLMREGLKKYSHSNAVSEDEIYFFRRLINPPKIGSESAQSLPDIKQQSVNFDREASPSIKVDPDMMMEDSLDGGPPSVGSGDMPTPMSNMITPISSRKKQLSKKVVTGYILYSGDVRRTVAAKHPESSFGDISRIVGNEIGKKLLTGYILYCSEVRRSVTANHSESTFGEISRIIGNQWRNLPAQEKQSWEEKAAKVNEESALKMADPDQYPSPSIAIAIPVGPPVENQVFECCWDNCDFQFEDIIDCYDHAAQEPHGHVFMHFANIPSNEAEYQCQWRGCGRVKKGAQPFPHVQRLSRHIKEVHILKGNGRVILPQDRSRNYVSSRTTPPTPTSAPNEAPVGNPALATPQSMSRQTPSPHTQFSGVGQMNVRPAEPMFVSVPPRPQRLLHSEAYIKYIEGLQADSKYISNWDKQLRANTENTPVPDQSRLPTHWLGNGAGNHGSVVNALWMLRDFMMKDALGINKTI